MLFKVTDKDLKEEPFVFWAGYCELEELLQHEDPIAYSRGVNGWRYDVYKIQNVYITTGYSRPRGCELTRLPNTIKQEYTEKLKKSRTDTATYYLALLELAQTLRDYALSIKSK